MKIIYIDCYYGFSDSMLLSALVDAGASLDEIILKARETVGDFDIEITEAKANSMDCKKVLVSDSDARLTSCNTLAELGVISAIETMGAELVICSPVYLKDNADGEVISALEKAGIETLPSSDIRYKMRLCDAMMLIRLCAESGPLPAMDIVSVGYGTSDNDSDSLVTVYVGEYNGQNNIFAKEEQLITV